MGGIIMILTREKGKRLTYHRLYSSYIRAIQSMNIRNSSSLSCRLGGASGRLVL